MSAHDFSRIPVFAKVPVKTQTKLAVNTPGDVYEQEADRVAEQVMRMPKPQLRIEGKAPLAVNEALARGGQPLVAEMRAHMEARLAGAARGPLADLEGRADQRAAAPLPAAAGAVDFSQVRIHTDEEAARSASMMNARAYTVGRDIVFAPGEYCPESAQGRALLAHELTHVLQQRRIPGRWLQYKKYTTPQPLDTRGTTSDIVKVADDDELDEARKIYQRIRKKYMQYGIALDSRASKKIYDEIAVGRAKGKPLDSYVSSVVAWTLDELKALEQALDLFEPLMLPQYLVGGPERAIGRVDAPPSPGGVVAWGATEGEVIGNQISLFNAMGADPKKILDTMVHELGHSFFGMLAAEFEKLPFWQMFPTAKTRKPGDPFYGYRATPKEALEREKAAAEKAADERAAAAEKERQAATPYMEIIDEVSGGPAYTVGKPPPPPQPYDLAKAVAETRELATRFFGAPLTERPPSLYGYKSPGEDAAESVKLYFLDRKAFETGFPARFKLVDDTYWKMRLRAKDLRGPKPNP